MLFWDGRPNNSGREIMDGIEKLDRKFKKSENQLEKSEIIEKFHPKIANSPKS
jgi:hypothetical protein